MTYDELLFMYNNVIEQNNYLKNQISHMSNQINELTMKVNQYEYYINSLNQKAISTNKIEEYINYLNTEMNRQQLVLNQLDTEIRCKQSQLIQLDEEILYQSFGLYQPMYNLSSSIEYKEKLLKVRDYQKQLIQSNNAVHYYEGWTVNNSKEEGRKMTNDNIRSILRAFNNECEFLINKVKFNNIDSIEKRIRKSFSDLNILYKRHLISIKDDYLNLKIKELYLCYEYELKKQEEKEEERKRQELLKEQQKLEQEIKTEQLKVEKEHTHYKQALQKVQLELANESNNINCTDLINRIKELEAKLSEIENTKISLEQRLYSNKAGYVYVISNIGAFGNNIYKIGVTRRLEPLERINELNNASVPFKFDVHCLVFSENAFELERKIHEHFNKSRVNKVNTRKEFFKIEDIKEIEYILNQYGLMIEFNTIPEAKEYRESMKIT